MWKDRIGDRYPWAKITDRLDELIYELSKAEDEEEVELSMLKLHFDNKIDLQFFQPYEREEIKSRIAILIRDTRKHQKLLGLMVEKLKEEKKNNEARPI